MKFITYLRNLITKKTADIENVRSQIKSSNDVTEIRSLGETLEALRSELEEAKKQLEEAEKGEGQDDGKEGEGGTGEGGAGEEGQRGVGIDGITRNANFANIYGSGETRMGQQVEEPYSSVEYRTAFKNYVQRGTLISEEILKRAGGDKGTTTSAELGMIIPVQIMTEFIKEVSKVYGQIYSKVRKLNVQGGIKFPISKLKAKCTWINETSVSDKLKAGDIKDFVLFEYNTLEIRVAQTLLSSVVTLALFESEITRIMVEAYVESMDKAIISGTGSGQPLGITKDPRVKNIVEFTEEEFSDWTTWRKKLFAKIPLSKRGQGEFLFSAATVEANLLTMKDKNDRPLYREATDLSVGNSDGSFFGRNVTLVEPDIVTDFDIAENDEIVGVYWTPNDYGINTNLEFGMKRYFDEDTNEWINKGLTIVDGKIIDPAGCYLIKKKINSPSA